MSTATDEAKVLPCLWFSGQAEEAVGFYVGLVTGSKVERVMRSPVDFPDGKAGDVLALEFTLGGLRYLAINSGGPAFSDAVSFVILCDDQAEADRLWDALTPGGTVLACGWLRDRWGVTWQVTPRRLMELMNDPDQARAGRAMAAMMQMKKIDIAALEAAAG